MKKVEDKPQAEPEQFPFGDADDVRNLDDYRFEVVVVPEWRRRFRVGSMTAKQRGAYDARMANSRKGKGGVPADFREWIVAHCVHDESRNRLFGDGDVAMLGKRSVAALEKLFEVACRLNGLSKEDAEEAEKN